MKRAILVVAVLVLAATGAQAIDSGPGGTVYWDQRTASPGNILLYKVDLSAAWGAGTVTQFDCVPFNGNSTDVSYYPASSTTDQLVVKGGIEIYSHRTDSSGTGTVLAVPTIPASAPTGPYGESAWVIDTVNPNVAGSAAAVSAPYPGSLGVPQYLRVVRAPENWQPSTLSHGLSMVAFDRYDPKGRYIHDQDGSGTIDASTAEVTDFSLTGGGHPEDAEFGADGALYYTTSTGTVQRGVWSGSTMSQATFFTIGGAGNPAQTAESFSSDGLALGKLRASGFPIAYTVGKDSNGKGAIFALKDGDGGGVSLSDSADCVTEVWKNGDFGITVTNDSYLQDLEIYTNPGTGEEWLFCSDYYGQLFVVQLVDNGMGASAGKQLLSTTGPGFTFSGFELDMNPVAGAPEPATLLLLGTGALGTLGWIRRRRVK